MHPVERFRTALADIPNEAFPDCLERVVRGELEAVAGGPIGVAAFPVSHGLYADPGWDHSHLPDFPAPGEGLMIVGNHPHSRKGALDQLREKGAHGDPALGTRLFHPAYFTRIGGRVPRRGNDRWFQHARELLLFQVHTMQPRVLVAFGGVALDELNRVGVDVPPLELNHPAKLDIDGTRTTVLYARHPSAPGTTRPMRASRVEALKTAWGTGQRRR